MDLHGKTVAITGGASGIGLAIATAAAERGATPAILDIDGAAAEDAAAALGGIGLAADVTDLAELERAFEQLDAVDVLVANAGIAPRATTVDAGDREEQRRILDVNLHGVWHTMWAGAPRVVDRRGHIVIISSVAAFIPTPAWAAYGASKAAVEALARSMRTELAPTRTTVGVAHFGVIDTPLVAGFVADPLTAAVEGLFPRVVSSRSSAEAAAEAVVRGIEQRAARTVFPGRWLVPYLLRGALGPLADAILARDPRMRRAMQDVRARDESKVLA